MSLSLKEAAYIVGGLLADYEAQKTYREVACLTKGCKNTALVPPWYVPYGDYCDQCRIELKDKESLEIYAEDDLTFMDEEEDHERD